MTKLGTRTILETGCFQFQSRDAEEYRNKATFRHPRLKTMTENSPFATNV